MRQSTPLLQLQALQTCLFLLSPNLSELRCHRINQEAPWRWLCLSGKRPMVKIITIQELHQVPSNGQGSVCHYCRFIKGMWNKYSRWWSVWGCLNLGFQEEVRILIINKYWMGSPKRWLYCNLLPALWVVVSRRIIKIEDNVCDYMHL